MFFVFYLFSTWRVWREICPTSSRARWFKANVSYHFIPKTNPSEKEWFRSRRLLKRFGALSLSCFRSAIFSRRDDQADSVTGQFNLFVVIITSWLNSGESIVPEPRSSGDLTFGLIKKTWSLFSEILLPPYDRLPPRQTPGKLFSTSLAINWKCFSADAFSLGGYYRTKRVFTFSWLLPFYTYL